jgi:hypothetical protein
VQIDTHDNIHLHESAEELIAGRRARDDQDSESDAFSLYEDERLRDVLL